MRRCWRTARRSAPLWTLSHKPKENNTTSASTGRPALSKSDCGLTVWKLLEGSALYLEAGPFPFRETPMGRTKTRATLCNQELVRLGGQRSMRVAVFAKALKPGLQAVHIDVNDRRGEEREHLADDKAADDGDTERLAEFRADAPAEREWQRAEERSHGSHQNGPEAQQASLVDGLQRRSVLLAFELHGKINHENRVFLDDANQKNDADERNHVQIGAREFNSENRADAGGRNRRKNGDGMNKTLIENAEDDVNGYECSDDKNELRG